MRYDPSCNNLTEIETGKVVVQFQENDELPPEYWQLRKDFLYAQHLAHHSRTVTPTSESTVDADRLLAMQLSEQEQANIRRGRHDPIGVLDRTYAGIDNSLGGVHDRYPPISTVEIYSQPSLEAPLYADRGSQRVTPDGFITNPNNRTAYDEAFARALQFMEFEIEDEIAETRRRNGEGTDFETKEIHATGRKRQLFTISTLICLVQIILLIVVCQTEGIASRSENPLYGPSAWALVKYGAKDAFLIVRQREWWRLFSAVFLHAGVVHILCNVFVQLQVGGYLNLVFGSPVWFLIYMTCGVFGNLFSCIFEPNSVGVGSSGALLGMLSAWIVWIVFRWKKIPENYRKQRNCQLIVLVVSVVATLAFSFTPFVDWAAHFGGFIMGILTGIFLLARELDRQCTVIAVRIASLTCIIGLYAWAVDYVNNKLDPRDPFALY